MAEKLDAGHNVTTFLGQRLNPHKKKNKVTGEKTKSISPKITHTG